MVLKVWLHDQQQHLGGILLEMQSLRSPPAELLNTGSGLAIWV